MARIEIPPGDYWFAGMGAPLHDHELWRALAAEWTDDELQPCPADLRLFAVAMATREAQVYPRAKREALARTPGPCCSRPLGHRGRHVALGEEPHVIAAWPGTEPVVGVAIADLAEVLDESRQAP